MENSPSVVAEEVKEERESLLQPAKELQIQDRARQLLQNEHHITLATTQSLPKINDRMSLPQFSGQNTPTHQQGQSKKKVKQWKKHGR